MVKTSAWAVPSNQSIFVGPSGRESSAVGRSATRCTEGQVRLKPLVRAC